MSKRQITRGGIVFNSKKDCAEHFRSIKESSAAPIRDGDDNFAFLRDIYWRNPEAPAANPISFAFAEHPTRPKGGKYRGMVVSLDNGEVWRFPSKDYGLEINDHEWANNRANAVEKIRLRHVKARAREMVDWQVQDFRRKRGNAICDICRLPSTELDVDHHPTDFIEIFDTWIERVDTHFATDDCARFGLLEISTDEHGSNPEFVNIEVFSDWQDYHMQMADFRLLCKKCHRTETTRKRHKK